jgi:hypothetical protein
MGMRRLASLLVLITALGVGLPSVYRTVHRRFFGVNHGVYLEDQAMEYYYPNEVRVKRPEGLFEPQRSSNGEDAYSNLARGLS